MKIHHLKCLTEYYWPMVYGQKTFDIRLNNRGFAVGDIVVQHEVVAVAEFENVAKVLSDVKPPNYGVERTGHYTAFKVNYICDYAQQDGYVVMSVENTDYQSCKDTL